MQWQLQTKKTNQPTPAERLRMRIQGMLNIRRGFTVDSAAADHVMPLGWLAWIQVVASLVVLRGGHRISADGAHIPNRGEPDVRFMTSEGT